MRNPQEPVVILLAAGKSQRFGTNKLVVRLPNNKTILQQSCDKLLTLAGNILVVLNSLVPSTENALQSTGIEVLSLPSTGMGESIAVAVRHRASDAGWVLCLADMPFIQQQTLETLMREIRQHPHNIIRLRYAQIPGHPVYFPKQFYAELIELTGDTGARDILLRHTSAVRWLDVDDEGILRDIDKQEDLPGYTCGY